jgi:hypothetical protein
MVVAAVPDPAAGKIAAMEAVAVAELPVALPVAVGSRSIQAVPDVVVPAAMAMPEAVAMAVAVVTTTAAQKADTAAQ